MNRASPFVSMIRGGRLAVGVDVTFDDPAVSDLMAALGYDFVWIDMEHNPLGLEAVHRHLLTLEGRRTAGLVRVRTNHPLVVKPLLELAPAGVVFPMIGTAEEAAEAVAACKYPPKGRRGFGPRRGIDYGEKNLDEYLRDADAQTLVIVQIESIQGVENLDAILAIEGIDSVCIGPMDLSASLGCLGRFDDSRYLQAVDRICQAVRAAGVLLGVSTGYLRDEEVIEWMDRGIQWISYSTDANNLAARSKLLLHQIRELQCRSPGRPP
jgi:2-keto-3-deoxy-L-rhamnonate aldolase RhmA